MKAITNKCALNLSRHLWTNIHWGNLRDPVSTQRRRAIIFRSAALRVFNGDGKRIDVLREKSGDARRAKRAA
jgi:hypothetical protein